MPLSDTFTDDDQDTGSVDALDQAAAELEADRQAGNLPSMREPAEVPESSTADVEPREPVPAGPTSDGQASPPAAAAGGQPSAAGGEPSQAPSGNPLAALFNQPEWAGLDDAAIAQRVGSWRQSVETFQQEFPRIRQQLAQFEALQRDPGFIEYQRQRAYGPAPQQPVQPTQPQYDPAMEAYYRTVDPATGQPAWKPETPAHVMQAAAQREAQQRQFAQQFLQDPGAAMQPHVNPLVQQEVQRQMAAERQYLQQQQQAAYLQHWTHQNQSWLYELGPNGQPIPDPISGGHRMSPLGRELYGVAEELQRASDPLVQLQLAQDILMARNYRRAGVDQLLAERRQQAAAAAPAQSVASPGSGGGLQPATAPQPANPEADRRLQQARRMASRNPSQAGAAPRAAASGTRAPQRLNETSRLEQIFAENLLAAGFSEADLYNE